MERKYTADTSPSRYDYEKREEERREELQELDKDTLINLALLFEYQAYQSEMDLIFTRGSSEAADQLMLAFHEQRLEEHFFDE